VRKIIAILIISMALVSLFAFLVNPVVVSYSAVKVHAMTVQAVNRAIGEIMHARMFSDLTVVGYGDDGRITSVQTDTIKMNDISGKIALSSQSHIADITKARLGVPVGTFTGLPILSGRGFKIPLRVIPVGAVYCSFSTDFIGGGINQTVHRIVLTARTTVSLIMPFGTRNINSEIDVLLCENLIIGEVPKILIQ